MRQINEGGGLHSRSSSRPHTVNDHENLISSVREFENQNVNNRKLEESVLNYTRRVVVKPCGDKVGGQLVDTSGVDNERLAWHGWAWCAMAWHGVERQIRGYIPRTGTLALYMGLTAGVSR